MTYAQHVLAVLYAAFVHLSIRIPTQSPGANDKLQDLKKISKGLRSFMW